MKFHHLLISTFCAISGAIVFWRVLEIILRRWVSPAAIKQFTISECIALLITVYFAWTLIVLTVSYVGPPSKDSPTFDFEKTGQLGDSFGVVNAVLTTAAAIAAFGAYYTQRQQLDAEKKSQQHEQVVRRFYAMLDAYRGMLTQVEYWDQIQEKMLTGMRAITSMENELLGKVIDDGRFTFLNGESSREYYITNGIFPTQQGMGIFENARGIYGKDVRPRLSGEFDPLDDIDVAQRFNVFFERRIGAYYGHILRVQMDIVRFIERERDNGILDAKTSEDLTQTFRVMLSDPEMHLLLYYGLRNGKSSGDVELIDRNHLLFGLLTKAPTFVIHRIPELAYYDKHTALAWSARMQMSSVTTQS